MEGLFVAPRSKQHANNKMALIVSKYRILHLNGLAELLSNSDTTGTILMFNGLYLSSRMGKPD